MDKIKLVIVGNIAHDINTYIKDKKKFTVINNGGAGYYSLIPASLYIKTGIVAKVGNDFDMHYLNSNNIDKRCLKVISTSKTTKFHHTYLSKDGQQRTFRPEIYEDTMININDFNPCYFDAEYIHVSTNFPSMQKKFIEYIRKNSKAKISIDTHEAYVEMYPNLVLEVFNMVDIAFIDKEFKSLYNCKAEVKIFKQGRNGCKYVSNNKTFNALVKEKEVVDKTGAGDVVAGVFLAKMALGFSEEESLQEAVNVATISISNYGVEFLTMEDI